MYILKIRVQRLKFLKTRNSLDSAAESSSSSQRLVTERGQKGKFSYFQRFPPPPLTLSVLISEART